nr:putative monovalent cation/H+ antiporter subunit A [Saprospiraceae bacterium]
MLTIILIGFVLAIGAIAIHRLLKNYSGMAFAVYPAAAFVWFLTQYQTVASGEVVMSSMEWLPSLGIALDFKLDGLSLLFALLITGIGAIVLTYAGTYMKGVDHTDRFFVALILFMASMLGLVLSDNIISLFVFWELTSFSSYFLIGFKHEDKASRKSALEALLITAGGGLALLAGLVLLGIGGGSMSISELLTRGNELADSGLFNAAMLLIIIGCFTKSAQFPFHFWLPSAMAAPTPVSAYLHSATMVKAGIYLLARMSPVFNGADGWHATLLLFGATTMIVGAIIAILQTDLKKILAYTTVSALGLLTMLLGIGTSVAIHAVVIFILAHALYKGCLFLVAGIVDHQTGSRDIRKLGRIFKDMPYTAITAIIACLSMAGIPPLFGFISKEFSYESTIGMITNSPLTTSAFFLTGVFFTAAAGMLSYMVFFGKRNKLKVKVHEAPVTMVAGPILMALLSLVFGLSSGWINPLLDQASLAILPGNESLKMGLWHGINTELLLSLATLLVGLSAFSFIYLNPRLMSRIEISEKIKPSYAYEQVMEGIADLSKGVTRYVQNGYLRVYVSMMVGTFCVLALIILQDFGIPKISILWSDFRVYDIVIGIIMIIACFYTVMAKSRLLAIAMLGIVGYGVAFVFIIFGAPDLAMTQILIETLTVVLFVLVLWKLPRYLIFAEGFIKFRYFLVSALFGGIMTWIVMIVTQYPLDSHLKVFFSENSYPLAMGKNVVNVILVDFRSMDTLGEIVVLGIAAIGVYGLVKFNGDKKGGKA